MLDIYLVSFVKTIYSLIKFHSTIPSMLFENLNLLPLRKNFFSKQFNLTLNFYPNGAIDGKLYPFAEFRSISTGVTGLYSTINSNCVLSFFTEFRDPNLISKTLISHLGEILTHDHKNECRFLRWLLIQDAPGTKIVDRDIEILFNSRHRDEVVETRKVKRYIRNHALQMIT
jgi:hypothetical protein